MKLAKLNKKAEIFYTIQGEGKSMGQPSVFVRTSLCNLHCIWCDTDYTWNWENTPFETLTNKKFKKDEYIIEMQPEAVAREIQTYSCRNVVLTGGEPLMQQDALAEVVRLLKQRDPKYKVEIETNGTCLPKPELDLLIDQYNVSPKLANSNNSQKIREKPAVIDFFSKRDKSNFKFVISQQSDLDEVLKLVGKYKINSSKVYLMPEGINASALIAKQQWLVEICKQHGFNYTDRLHIHIYGTKRGV